MALIKGVDGKYDGSVVMPDGRIITPEGELKNILFYNNEILFKSPIIYIHPAAYAEFNIKKKNNRVRMYSVNNSNIHCVWVLSGRTHPYYEKYLEAMWPD